MNAEALFGFAPVAFPDPQEFRRLDAAPHRGGFDQQKLHQFLPVFARYAAHVSLFLFYVIRFS